MVPAAFKIADAYVEIHSQLARNDFKKITQQLSTVLPIVGTLGMYAAGAASALFSLASSIGYSTIAFAAAIPAAIGLGSAIAVATMIFKDMENTAMKPVQESLTKMRSELQKLAIAYAKPGIMQFMRSLEKLMPIIRTHVRNLAFGFGVMADDLARLASTSIFKDRLAQVLNGSAKAMGDLYLSAEPVVDILVTIGAAAVPVFQRLTRWIRMTVEHWDRWLRMKEQTGALANTFKESADEFSIWAQTIYNFISGLVGLMSAGRSEGHRLAGSLLEVSESFKTWSWDPETQGKVKELLEFLNTFDYEKLTQIATSIMTIGVALRLMTGASQAVSGLMAFISLGPVAIIIGIIAFNLALLAGALVAAYFASEELRNVMDRLWNWVSENVIPILVDLYHWLSDKILTALNTAITDTLPKFEAEWRKIEKAWIENKDQIIPLVDKLLQLADVIITRGIPAVGWLAGQLAGPLAAAIGIALTWMNGLNRALDTIGSTIETVERTIAGFVDDLHSLASAVGREVDRINSFLRTISLPSIPNPFSGWGRAHGGVVGAFAHGGVSGAAAGGARSGFTLVGEAGPELVHLGAGARVRSNPDTRRMLGGSGGGYQINFYVQGSIRSDQDLKRMLRDELTNMGVG